MLIFFLSYLVQRSTTSSWLLKHCRYTFKFILNNIVSFEKTNATVTRRVTINIIVAEFKTNYFLGEFQICIVWTSLKYHTKKYTSRIFTVISKTIKLTVLKLTESLKFNITLLGTLYNLCIVTVNVCNWWMLTVV